MAVCERNMLVRVEKPKETRLTVVERQAVAAFLWDKWLHRVAELARNRRWDVLIHVLLGPRLVDLESEKATKRVAALMYFQGAKLRANGRVYASDVRRTLNRAAAKFGLDPNDLRAAVHDGLSRRLAGDAEDEGWRLLAREIGLEVSPVRENEWPGRGRVIPFPVSDDQLEQQNAS